jgi:AraC family transcriptional regulator of adaptative response / DNA-3-methyladenine glycosylase II
MGNERDTSVVKLTLTYRAPYDWTAMIDFLAARAISGVEVVEPRRYRRTTDIDGRQAIVEVVPVDGQHALEATIRFRAGGARPVESIAARVGRVFDLTADVRTIDSHLAADELLGPLVAARPGLRVPGAWDGFELAVRAVLGQQITVGAARQLAARLVATYGEPLASTSDEASLTAIFPRPERLVDEDLAAIGMPAARAKALSSLAAATVAQPRLFDRDRDLETAVARLKALPGIGEWTAQYIAMRVLREPDAFPAADIGLLRAMTGADGLRPSPAALLARAESWRPWRAYAAQHLWTAGPTAVPATHATQNREEAVA